MAEEGEEAFEACLQQALNFLADRGFSRELRQEQKSCIKQLITGGDVLAVLPTGFGKSMIFQQCYPSYMSSEKYCERSDQGGLFNGDFGWLVVWLPPNGHREWKVLSPFCFC